MYECRGTSRDLCRGANDGADARLYAAQRMSLAFQVQRKMIGACVFAVRVFHITVPSHVGYVPVPTVQNITKTTGVGIPSRSAVWAAVDGE